MKAIKQRVYSIFSRLQICLKTVKFIFNIAQPHRFLDCVSVFPVLVGMFCPCRSSLGDYRVLVENGAVANRSYRAWGGFWWESERLQTAPTRSGAASDDPPTAKNPLDFIPKTCYTKTSKTSTGGRYETAATNAIPYTRATLHRTHRVRMDDHKKNIASSKRHPYNRATFPSAQRFLASPSQRSAAIHII